MNKFLAILLTFSLILPAKSASFDEFLSILARTESDNNPKAYNKHEKAIGIYQIRPDYFEDARDFDKSLSKYTQNDCYNPKIAGLVVNSYMRRYEKKAFNNNDFYSMAMAHNGGPSWREGNQKKKNKLKEYWRRFQSRK